MDSKRKGFSVKVMKEEIVTAERSMHDQWVPFSNLDFLDAPQYTYSFFCYKKQEMTSFTDKVNILKTSLPKALAYYYQLAGEIVQTASGEPEIHCNNRGVPFLEAVADVELRELNFQNPDDVIEGLMPKNQDRPLVVQVTELKCGGMVLGCLFDHELSDGYSVNMFLLCWAQIAQSKPLSLLPSFRRSVYEPRRPGFYGSSTEDMFAPFSTIPPLVKDSKKDYDDGDLLANRIYCIEGKQLVKLQSSVNEVGSKKITKVEAFTSFFWKTVAMSFEDSGNQNEICCVSVAVDGRRRLSEGDGVEKEKLMAAQIGNAVSLPFLEKRSKEVVEKPLTWLANEVHELLKNGTTKEHFKEVIDYVEAHRPKRVLPRPLLERPAVGDEKGLTIIVSSGYRFSMYEDLDFGWGKVVFGSCHVPSGRKDCFVMTMVSPCNQEDWLVYTRLPVKHLNYIEAHAGHVFKPVTVDYLEI